MPRTRITRDQALQIRPLLIELIDILGQLALLQGDRKLRLIEEIQAYGIDLDLDLQTMPIEVLEWLRNSLRTVGNQILECFHNLATPAPEATTTAPDETATPSPTPEFEPGTPEEAFTAIFPNIEFQFNDSQPSAITRYNTDDPDLTVIEMPTRTFYHCVRIEITDIPEEQRCPQDSHCPDDETEETTEGEGDDQTTVTKVYRHCYRLRDYMTVEANLRHELGHIFLRQLHPGLDLIQMREQSIILDEFIAAIGATKTQTAQGTSYDPGFREADISEHILNLYYYNARRATADETEDFADTFALMGRFVNQELFPEERHFYNWYGFDDADILTGTEPSSFRIDFMNSQFCCWIGEMLQHHNLTNFYCGEEQ